MATDKPNRSRSGCAAERDVFEQSMDGLRSNGPNFFEISLK